MAEFSGAGLAALSAGALLLYGGITGKSPLTALHSIILGNDPRTDPATQAILSSLPHTQSDQPLSGTGAVGGGTAHVVARGANQKAAQLLLAHYGWGPDQMTPLISLWDKESGWSNTADTRQTGAGGDHPGSPVFAYGIAQARPATKYPKAGQPPDLGGSADPETQIRWGLSYIKSRYGSPAAAWQHEVANNWY